MYYLFLTKQSDLDAYKKELDRVLASMDSGKPPVYSELRSARTSMFETLPYNVLSGIFLIASTYLISKIKLPEPLMVAVVLVINSICGTVSFFLFTLIKHWLRVQLCKRLKIEPTETNIAAMESLEYQSV